jgi:hypothetical protein
MLLTLSRVLYIVISSQITGVLNYRCSDAVGVMEVGVVVVTVVCACVCVCVCVAFVKY